jgi:prevent-host-death family protein
MKRRDVAVRELRNHVSRILCRVERGERVRITVNGRAVAELAPLAQRREAVPWAEVMAGLRHRRADAALRDELRAIAPDTTDDLGSR